MFVSCLVCKTLVDGRGTLGGVIYEDDYWLIDHALPPVFVLGKLIIKLKRHCENLGELTTDEAHVLGTLIRRVTQAVQMATGAEKVHVASYGEGVPHVHFLVTPRTTAMPASNIQLSYWWQWRRLLYRIGWRNLTFSSTEVADMVQQVQLVMGAYPDS